MHCFPIVRRDHLNRIPGAAVQEGPIRTFAGAFLTANAEIRIDFDASEGRVILVRDPKHASFDRAVLNASRRARTPRAAIGRDGQDARPFLAGGFAVAHGHGPVLLYYVEHLIVSRFLSAAITRYRSSYTLTQAFCCAQRCETSNCMEVIFPLTKRGRVPFAFSLA
jgi:hypothetical protein